MRRRIATITSVVSLLMTLILSPVFAFAQDSPTNRNRSAKGEMKQSGKEAANAGKSLGHNVKHGRVARGGKNFGKHSAKAGKHFGKGTVKAVKKTGKVIKRAAKP